MRFLPLVEMTRLNIFLKKLIKEDTKPSSSILQIAIGKAMPLKTSRKQRDFYCKFLEKNFYFTRMVSFRRRRNPILLINLNLNTIIIVMRFLPLVEMTR